MGIFGIHLLIPADIVGRDRVPSKPRELAPHQAAKKLQPPKIGGCCDIAELPMNGGSLTMAQLIKLGFAVCPICLSFPIVGDSS